MIPVTKPFLPPREMYQQFLEGIWQRDWLTNNGPLVNQLEFKLREYLDLEHFLFLGNGTIALQIAIKVLGLKGKIITTPFSYVATTSSIVWENCSPIFVDIDENTLNIDPAKIERLIDKEVTGIIATHCFGNSCDIDAIDKIAKKHNLKVIYDAAHCFGSKYKGRSIFSYGDISTASFHATKLFHTIEGGAVITNSHDLFKKVGYLRNFGHDGPEKFKGVGINGKNSEFHAAMGLCNLKFIDVILQKRKEQYMYYELLLQNVIKQSLKIQDHCDFNFSYYPVIFQSEIQTLHIKQELEQAKVFTRRYFYPSLSSLEYIPRQSTPISDDISKRILCLPLYHYLSKQEQNLIGDIIIKTLANQRYI